LVNAVNQGDRNAVAASFTSPTHWEVYQHFGDGVLTSSASAGAHGAQLSSHGDHWTLISVEPPVGAAGLPDSAVYGATLTVRPHARPIRSEAKIVMECHTGLIQRMVGPTNTK
jgi:hypothetical protein